MPLDHLKRRNPKRPEPTTPVNPPPAVKAATPKAPPPKQMVVYTCGHKVPVAHLESMACPGCREGNRKARSRRRSETKDRAREWPCRLPAGSVKLIDWTGEAWAGTLTIPGASGATTFEATAPTEREVCHALHGLYVESLDRTAG